jgi:hypothetical protein
MPETFQDTLLVCKRLGVRYLWIDSLCIIQDKDDLQDWYREASLMNKVYLHSYCNISAADAEDSTKGLFRARRLQLYGSMSVDVNLEGFESDSGLRKCIMTDAFLWLRNVADALLNRRGWVLQERLLSPRILHFCRDEIFWECREHAACESDPKGSSSVYKLMSYVFIKLWETGNHGMLELRRQVPHTPWLHFWYRVVVVLYSHMELSIPSDKLVALSGIAKHVMPRMSSTYVAGMWQERLERSLLWTVLHNATSTRPLFYRAPSWSWASVDGHITSADYTVEDCLIHVEDVVLKYASEDMTGAVTDGWLDLRGTLKPLRLWDDDCGSGPEWPITFDGHIVKEDEADATINFDVEPVAGSLFASDNAEERLFYMPAQEGSSTSDRGFVCLLLRLVEKEPVIFERIGVITTNAHKGKEQLLEHLDEVTKARLPCLRYENGLHTVRII